MSAPDTQVHLLICATHRTGSNMLEQHLKAAGVAGAPREFYSPQLSRGFASKEGLPDPDAHFSAYCRSIQEHWRSPNSVFGVKIMWRHLDVVQARLQADPAAAAQGLPRETAWESILALHPNPLVIHMTRNNKVRQAISMVRAKQSGVYSTVHLDRGTLSDESEPEYDFHVIQFHVDKLTQEDENWDALLKAQGAHYHRVVFEEFVKDPRTNTLALLASLGLPQPTTWEEPPRPTRRQSDQTSENWYVRYQKDAQRLANQKDVHREKRHRARKALERHARREARWTRWEKSVFGRILVRLERRFVGPPPPALSARGDGVRRPAVGE